jgi:DNA-binding NtrC family response regulator
MRARILLVEDEVNMARTLRKNLERGGYSVEHAPNGEAALARLGEAPFDVIITDLKMPVMDGMALLRALHERGETAATVVLTGYGTIESAVEAMKLGASTTSSRTPARRRSSTPSNGCCGWRRSSARTPRFARRSRRPTASAS